MTALTGSEIGTGDVAPVEVKKAGPAPKVTKEEFTALETKVNDGFSAIMTKLEEMKTPPQPVITGSEMPPVKIETEGFPDHQTPIPPAWRQLVDELLGPNVPCFLDLPENGGQKFGVYIPKEMSNASQMHWSMNKFDKRSKELGNTGVKGVKEFLLKVRRNLLASGAKLPVYQNN